MTYQDILVLGGTGFVGQCVVDRLVAQGRKVCVPTRRRANGRALLVLPTVEVVEADIHDAAALRGLLEGRDAVINLVGILHDSGRPTAASAERYGPGFAAAHAELPRTLAVACREAGVQRVLHVSALGADPAGVSGYLRSKGDGERAIVESAGLSSTIFRPSVVFGSGDSFLNLFAGLAALLPVLFIGGAQSRLQPVWVQDLASAIGNALDARATFGRIYEICGPTVYTLQELVAFAARASGHPRPVIGLPDGLAMIMAAAFEHLPGPTLLSRDNLRSLHVDSVASVQPYRPAPELGFHPAPLEPEATVYLSGLHPRTRFGGFRARAGR
jgi:NADH dehydrogenase